MEIQIESPHLTLSSPLETFINAKVKKLEQHNERLIRSEVCLKIDKSSKEDNKICEIRVYGPKIDLFASQRSMTFEDAIIETMHALEKQLRKNKTKKEKGREELQMEDSASDETEE